MTTARTATQKVGDWQGAFTAIREEITPPAYRTILQTMEGMTGVADLAVTMALAKLVAANDRAAAIVAALLTANGIKPVGGEWVQEDPDA